MKVYKGVSASPGLVLGQVSRLEHHVETFSHGPFNPERELRLLANAVHTAQNELDSMAERSAMESSSFCAVCTAFASSRSSRSGLKGPWLKVSTWCSSRLT